MKANTFVGIVFFLTGSLRFETGNIECGYLVYIPYQKVLAEVLNPRDFSYKTTTLNLVM
jgi:hypothetical protein